MTQPVCFISYSWDSKKHKSWVYYLAQEIRQNSVKTHLDQRDLKPGMDIPHYMESCVRNADFVLLICTPAFAKKANAGSGGVGYEKAIVTGEIFQGAAEQTKFVPILRKGQPHNAIPSYLKGKLYIDFRSDRDFRNRFEILLRHLHDLEPEYIPPPVERSIILRSTPTELAQETEVDIKLSQQSELEHLYEYAYRMSGLNLSRIEAEQWAEQWINRFEGRDFQIFRTIFDYAVSPKGLNLTRDKAKIFAEDWMLGYKDRDFEAFKAFYLYALSPEGLNKDNSRAMTWAKRKLLSC